MTITLHLPPGHRAMGAPNPNGVLGGDGAIFFGLCTKINNAAYAFRVYRQLGDAAANECLSVQGLGGQGQIQLQLDGSLWACGFAAAGDGQVARMLPVLEYVPVQGERDRVPGALGSYIPAPHLLQSEAVNGQIVSGGRWLDMAALFGVPSACRAYAVRLAAESASPNVRARLGTEQVPYALTVNTQAANLEVHGFGIVTADADGRVYLSVAPIGAGAQVWVQLAGWWG